MSLRTWKCSSAILCLGLICMFWHCIGNDLRNSFMSVSFYDALVDKVSFRSIG